MGSLKATHIKMKIALICAVIMLCTASLAVAEEIQIRELVQRDSHGVVRPILVQNEQGQVGIILSVQPIAPFPQPRTMPPSRMAMMRMMATCRPETFESCGVHPNQPVCPMKLAMCLVKVKASTPDKISTTCGASLDNLAQYAAVLRAAKPAPVEAARKEDAEREVSPVEVTDEMQMQTKPQHHHSEMACVMHRVIHFLTHQGTFFPGHDRRLFLRMDLLLPLFSLRSCVPSWMAKKCHRASYLNGGDLRAIQDRLCHCRVQQGPLCSSCRTREQPNAGINVVSLLTLLSLITVSINVGSRARLKPLR